MNCPSPRLILPGRAVPPGAILKIQIVYINLAVLLADQFRPHQVIRSLAPASVEGLGALTLDCPGVSGLAKRATGISTVMAY